MTIFLRVLDQDNKELALGQLLHGASPEDMYEVNPDEFRLVPGSPFSYWASHKIRNYFSLGIGFQSGSRITSVGASTKDNFRYTRLWTEVGAEKIGRTRSATLDRPWVPFAMGGRYSPFYRDLALVLNWAEDGRELKAAISEYRGSRGWGYQWSAALNGHDYYFEEGLTWPLRASRFAPQAMPSGCIFSGRGYAAFAPRDQLLGTLAILNSAAFDYLFKTALGRFGHPEFLVGILQIIPFVEPDRSSHKILSDLAARAWSIMRHLDSKDETSHAFVMPLALRNRFGDLDVATAKVELGEIQTTINEVVFELYDFPISDRKAAMGLAAGRGEEAAGQDETGDESRDEGEGGDEDDDEDESKAQEADTEALLEHDVLSWAIGVAFGRFDWRLASGERELPLEPDPFDALPTKTPGMLPDGDPPFHTNPGILVDDFGNPHDLPHLIGVVLERVRTEVAIELRPWLRRDFFPSHFRQYSKSRRKAPIYWPLSTASGAYTLWLYYPALTDQTLFVAANDFVGIKLDREIEPALRALRQKTGRSREEERALEELQTLHDELRILRDELLRLAPIWKPNHDDGVQITAAPLWRLFRHRPWQTVLRDTWEKLEQGDYDWAHLAMVYRPNQVREKCRSDKSLAIAHDLEHLYEPPPEAPGKVGRGRRKKG